MCCSRAYLIAGCVYNSFSIYSSSKYFVGELLAEGQEYFLEGVHLLVGDFLGKQELEDAGVVEVVVGEGSAEDECVFF
jgi:hypothetical protein